MKTLIYPLLMAALTTSCGECEGEETCEIVVVVPEESEPEPVDDTETEAVEEIAQAKQPVASKQRTPHVSDNSNVQETIEHLAANIAENEEVVTIVNENIDEVTASELAPTVTVIVVQVAPPTSPTPEPTQNVAPESEPEPEPDPWTPNDNFDALDATRWLITNNSPTATLNVQSGVLHFRDDQNDQTTGQVDALFTLPSEFIVSADVVIDSGARASNTVLSAIVDGDNYATMTMERTSSGDRYVLGRIEVDGVLETVYIGTPTVFPTELQIERTATEIRWLADGIELATHALFTGSAAIKFTFANPDNRYLADVTIDNFTVIGDFVQNQ
jgi:hypothetical protein